MISLTKIGHIVKDTYKGVKFFRRSIDANVGRKTESTWSLESFPVFCEDGDRGLYALINAYLEELNKAFLTEDQQDRNININAAAIAATFKYIFIETLNDAIAAILMIFLWKKNILLY